MPFLSFYLLCACLVPYCLLAAYDLVSVSVLNIKHVRQDANVKLEYLDATDLGRGAGEVRVVAGRAPAC
jgi:hypothetical protein